MLTNTSLKFIKLEKPRARLELRRHFFSNRVIDACNSLPDHMVEATSTNMFKLGRLTTATSLGVHKLETTSSPSWPSDNLKDGLTGKSQVNHSLTEGVPSAVEARTLLVNCRRMTASSLIYFHLKKIRLAPLSVP